MVYMTVSTTREERYWAKVDRRGPDECWPWRAFLNEFGYGMFRGGTQQLAHRFGYELEQGAIPTDAIICHHCDYPACQNPSHLYAGTPATNTADKLARGRAGTAPQPGMTNGMHKLTTEQVIALRSLRDSGWTQDALAARFGISQTQVGRIVRGERWKITT
jgi:hypothetical protein